MLHSDTYAIAQALTGYERFSEEEYLQQWEAEVTYDRAKPCTKPPINGNISKDKATGSQRTMTKTSKAGTKSRAKKTSKTTASAP